MLPDFILIGAPRAGTTWIAKNLEAHPEVFFPRKKELHYFDYQFDKGLDFYRSYFRGGESSSAVGEATPAYLHYEPAAARIRKILPDVKLIASLRNPVDRIYSRYWNSRGHFEENLALSFEEKIEQKPVFIEEGFYVDHLKRYLGLFPEDQVLVLLFDDLKTDPAAFMSRIYRFIGVSGDFSSELLEHQINAASKQKLIVRNRSLYWAGRALRRIGMHAVANRVEQRNEAEIPGMAPETRSKLIEIYREKNRELEALIGRDLSHWNA